MSSFSDPDQVARYTEGPVRQVPGFRDMQRMAALLLAESLGPEGEVLVLGAGGGLELRLFAEGQPGWRFTGVDPSAEMLALAREVAAPFAARIALHEGYIETAPDGPFDGATCLLTMHFVPREQRVPTLRALRQRLKPGAPLILAHHSFPQDEARRALWLSRYAAFAAASGVAEANARNAAKAIGERLPILSPREDEAALAEAGFTDISLFYAGFSFRGWIATA
ncbi:class I SAM-dependent methyltransferase [Paracoccus aminophilus]|uniref:Methyltransferase n=1 Tax=Paracoccus aminophilus JCM 7686 TaxID=1367847 RepID=S5Y1I8_PARAH|nr:class I SAM-dependent methyltransferase [Paracoccus aminophilus]AGT09555.1 methyltransferase [Paracoccus aminophilus JCM 7686]